MGAAIVCILEGCQKQARTNSGVSMCGMHYHRQYRTGRLDLFRQARAPKRHHSAGYVLVDARAHPLADSTGYVYEHRKIFYDAYGEGPFRCCWCQKRVGWYDMHVDHLNADPADNRLENLDAACVPCNVSRGFLKMRETKRQNGLLLTLGLKTQCITEWAAEIGMSGTALKSRIDHGWPLELALTQPPGNFGPRDSPRRQREARVS